MLERVSTVIGVRELDVVKGDAQRHNQHKNSRRSTRHVEINDDEDKQLNFSLPSLIRFLEKMIEDRFGLEENLNDAPAWHPHNHANTNTFKMATAAYAHAAEVSRAKLYAGKENLSIGADELYILLRKLHNAQTNGIKILALDQTTSFVKSIQIALDAQDV